MGSGYATAVANIAITVIQLEAMRKITHLQMDTYKDRMIRSDGIARLIEARAAEQQDLWREHFRDCEIRYVQEVCAARPDDVNYRELAGDVRSVYAPRFDSDRREALDARFNSCEPSSCAADREMAVSKAAAMGWGMEAAARAAEDEHTMNMAQWDERRNWVVSAGHGYYGDPTGALLSAARIYQRSADAAAGTFEGAARAIGAVTRILRTGLRDLTSEAPTVVRPGSEPIYVPRQPAKTPVEVVPPMDRFPSDRDYSNEGNNYPDRRNEDYSNEGRPRPSSGRVVADSADEES